MNTWVRLYVTDAHCLACFYNPLLFSLMFRALLTVWNNWLIFSLTPHYGSCIYSFYEVWLSKISKTNQLHGAESFLGKLIVSELVQKVPAPITYCRFKKYLNIQQCCFENLTYHELFWYCHFWGDRSKCLLQFHGIAVSDAGRYICLARNSAGDAEAAAEVLVNGE
jgi:hypothetical protein